MHLLKLSGRWEQPPQGLCQNEAVISAPKMNVVETPWGKSQVLLSWATKSFTSWASHLDKGGVADSKVKIQKVIREAETGPHLEETGIISVSLSHS
jgi:hypothetical protein